MLRERVHNAIARIYTAFLPRAYEAGSILLVATGINLITSRISPPVYDAISASGLCLTISGTLLFFAAGRVEELYEIGRRRAQEAPYQNMSVSELAFIAWRSRIATTKSRAKDSLLLFAIVVFLLAGVGLFAGSVVLG